MTFNSMEEFHIEGFYSSKYGVSSPLIAEKIFYLVASVKCLYAAYGINNDQIRFLF